MMVLSDDGPINPQHVEVSGCCNISINLILLYAFVGLNYSN